MRLGISILAGVGIILSFDQALASCLSFSEIQSVVHSGDEVKAMEYLECRKEKFPDDLDSKELLANLRWWRDETEEAERLYHELPGQDAYRRRARFRINGAYAFSDGKMGRIIHDYDLSGTARYFKKNSLGVGLQSIGKSFRGVPIKYDRLLRFDHHWAAHRSAYLSSSIEWNLSRNYSAEHSVFLDPHYLVTPSLDLGLGFRWKNYPIEDAFTLIPTASFSSLSPWIFSFRGDFLLKPSRLVSGELKVEYPLLSHLKVRASGGGGKTDEGDAIIDEFWQTTIGAEFSAMHAIDLTADFQIYRGEVREENKFSGGIRCFF